MIKYFVSILLVLTPLTATTPRPGDHLQKDNDYHARLSLFIRVINSEAYGQSYTEKLRVGSVILNRLHDPDFPKTLHGVIYQKNQFKGLKTKLFEINNTTIKGKESINAGVWLFDHGSILPKNVVYFHNPVTGKDRKWISKIKHKLYFKGDGHWYFKK